MMTSEAILCTTNIKFLFRYAFLMKCYSWESKKITLGFPFENNFTTVSYYFFDKKHYTLKNWVREKCLHSTLTIAHALDDIKVMDSFLNVLFLLQRTLRNFRSDIAVERGLQLPLPKWGQIQLFCKLITILIDHSSM